MIRQNITRNIAGGIIAMLMITFLVSWLARSPIPFFESISASVKIASLVIILIILASLLFLALIAIVKIFPRWFPITFGDELTYTQTDLELFQRQYRIGILVFLGFATLIGLISKVFLTSFANICFQRIFSRYVLPTNPAYWALPAISAGIFLAGIPTWLSYRWYLKERFPRFLSFNNQKLRFDQRKAGQTIIFYGLLFTLSLALAGFNLFLRIDQNGVSANHFFGVIADNYEFSDITRIQEIILLEPGESNHVIDHSFSIQFLNGRQWQSISFGTRPIPQVYFEALHYAAVQSGRPFEQTIQHRGSQ